MRLNKVFRVCHDMRSSLTSVKEGVALVRDGTLGKINKKQKKYLQIAEDGISKVVTLIDSIPKLK